MKTKYLVMSVAAVALIGMTGCSSDSNDTASSYKVVTPTSADSYEGSTGDNNLSTAGTLSVGGTLQSRSIFPVGDEDWVAVQLQGGTVYELFTTNLNEVGDTYLYLYDENGTQLARDDDHLYLDSDIEEYNATYSGTHYLKVRSFSINEATSYQLGVRVHVDVDNDGYTPTFDCNDNNDTIYATATEILGDGIDQDCSGVDALDANTTDPYELDNDLASAKAIPVSYGSSGETQHRNDIYSKMRTLDTTSDTDFYSFTVPAHSASYIIEASYNAGLNDFDWFGYDENGTEVISSNGSIYEFVVNDTDAPLTYKAEIRSNGVDTGWYVPYMVPAGTDLDGDGYYTQDWDSDCDDTDALVYPGGDDSNTTDGIDSDCNGIDG